MYSCAFSFTCITCIHMGVYMYTFVYSAFQSTYMSCIWVCVYTCVYLCIHVYTCVHKDIYRYRLIHIGHSESRLIHMTWLIQSCESWLMIVNPGQGSVCPLCISPPVCRHQDVICNNKNEQNWCNETRNLILNLARVVCAQFAFPLQFAGTRTQFATINTHSKSV